MAQAIYHRYCTKTPERYEMIGQRLGLTPEHARRLVDRGLVLLSRTLSSQQDKPGNRLQQAIDRRRLPG